MVRFKPDVKMLYWLAVVLSIILAVELLANGYSKYFLNEAGRPANYIRRGLEYTVLNVIYFAWLIPSILRRRRILSIDGPNLETRKSGAADSDFGRQLRAASIFLLLALISFPVTADVYLYLQTGLMCLNGVNPYLHRSVDFASALIPHLSWREATHYGPIQLGVCSLLALFLPLGILPSVYILKGLCLGLHILNARLIGSALRDSSYRELAMFAYLVNPVLIFDQVANAHLDVLACTMLILLLIFLKNENHAGATAINLASVFVKTYSIVWVPIYYAYLLRNRRWASLAAGVSLWVTVLVVFSLTILRSGEAWARLSGPGWMAAGSLCHIASAIIYALSGVLPEVVVRKQAGVVLIFKMMGNLGYCIFYAWLLWRFFFVEQGTKEALSNDMGWATLILFLFATPWFQPWYATVLVPFVVINRHAYLFSITAAVYTVIASVSYYVLAYGPARIPLLAVSFLTVGPPIILICQGLVDPRVAERCWNWLKPASACAVATDHVAVS